MIAKMIVNIFLPRQKLSYDWFRWENKCFMTLRTVQSQFQRSLYVGPNWLNSVSLWLTKGTKHLSYCNAITFTKSVRNFEWYTFMGEKFDPLRFYSVKCNCCETFTKSLNCFAHQILSRKYADCRCKWKNSKFVLETSSSLLITLFAITNGFISSFGVQSIACLGINAFSCTVFDSSIIRRGSSQ